MALVREAVTGSLEYPECPYAFRHHTRAIGCRHPKRGIYAFCASYHSLAKCPFDIHEELHGKRKPTKSTVKVQRYKCTYRMEEGAPCPVFRNHHEPHPSYCHAYDTTIWNYNPDKVCENCKPLRANEKPKRKHWCSSCSCDTTSDPNEEDCTGCPCDIIVFDYKDDRNREQRK